MSAHPLHAGFVLLYLLALMALGAWKARKVKTQEDFSLAGRGLPTFVLVGTLLATWIGTGSIFGNAQETYEVGAPAFLLPIAGGLGIVALYLLAARIRRFGQFTIQDILEARFGVGARVLGTLTLVLAYVIIVSYQYRAGYAVLQYLTEEELSRAAGIGAVALFVIAYTALAGMISVAYTDVANGLLMTLGIVCALPILLADAGGVEAALAALPEARRSPFGHYGATALLSVLMPAFLLLIGDANMYQRFFSARDAGSARRSAAWMFLGVLFLELAIIATALLGSSLVAQGKLAAPANPAHVIVGIAFAEGLLPPFLGAMLVATIVAIVVSTADSYLLSPATSIVRDVYQRFLDPRAPERRVVLVGRLVVVVLGLSAMGLAFTSEEFFEVALFAYTIYGAGITPVLLAAFFWKRANGAGAVASILAGVGTALAWRADLLGIESWTNERLGTEIDAVLPAFPVALLALIVVSLLGAPPSEARVRSI